MKLIKLASIILASILSITLIACSAKEADTVNLTDNNSIESDSQSNTAEPAPIDDEGDSETTQKEADDIEVVEDSGELISFSNEKYGFKISFPAQWEAPREKENRNGLTVGLGTNDLSNSIFVLVREIPEETPTIEEYASTKEDGEMVTINNVQFLKSVTSNDQSHYYVYTAFVNEQAYEIAATFSNEYYDANEQLVAQIIDSIEIS